MNDEKKEFIVCDGSYLEGGGQILRNCMSLSALLDKNISIVNIRCKRSNPGLRAQHLIGIRLINNIFQGTLSGDHIGSCQMQYMSNKLKSPSSFNTVVENNKKIIRFDGDIKTAGSICLLLQAAIPCLIYLPFDSILTLTGGTNADMAPQLDYCILVLLPILKKYFNINIHVQINKRGFYPRGGGQVNCYIKPVISIPALELLERGAITVITGICFTSGKIPSHVGQRMHNSAVKNLKKNGYGRNNSNIKIDIEIVHFDKKISPYEGCGIVLVAHSANGCHLGASSLGKKGISAEDVGLHASNELIITLAADVCVDRYLSDQLIVFMALANGTSRILAEYPLSLHCQTAIYFARTLTGAEFNIIKTDNNKCIIECEGVNYNNKFL